MYDEVNEMPSVVGKRVAGTGAGLGAKLSAIPQALNQQKKIIHVLLETLEQLEHRLTPVLETMAEDVDDVKPGPVSGVLSDIETNTRLVDKAVAKLRSVRERLQM